MEQRTITAKDILADLGIYGLKREQDKSTISRLKRFKQIGDDLDWLKYLKEQMKKRIADIEKTTGEIEMLGSGKGDLTNAQQI